jgi:hypothetical protein
MPNMYNVGQRIIKLLGGQAILVKVPRALIFDLVTTQKSIDGQRKSDGRPNGRTDKLISVYPLTTLLCGSILTASFLCT